MPVEELEKALGHTEKAKQIMAEEQAAAFPDVDMPPLLLEVACDRLIHCFKLLVLREEEE